jgi:CHRD domain
MRRGLLLAFAGVLLLGSVAPARAQVVELAATLTGSNEVPPVLTGAYGVATVTLNMATQDVSWNIQVFNMPTGTNNAHFHVGGTGVAGPVVVNVAFPPTISNDYVLSGTANASALQPRRDQGIGSWEDFIQSLLGEQTYLNVHSQNNPGGEIRGQVVRVR